MRVPIPQSKSPRRRGGRAEQHCGVDACASRPVDELRLVVFSPRTFAAWGSLSGACHQYIAREAHVAASVPGVVAIPEAYF